MAVVISIIGKYDDKGIAKAQKELAGLGGSADKNSKVLGALGGAAKIAGVAALGAAVGFGAFALKGVEAASDLGEAVSKANVIFGKDGAKEIEAWAGTAAKTLGQSKQQAIDAAATFAIFGKSAGLTGQNLTGFSTKLGGLASDLASFNNTSTDEAITAIGAALRGESEPIRKYGVLLDDATLKAEYFAITGKKVTGTLTPQQKVLAAQSSIMKQTADAQGDFARTSDGLANSQKTLESTFANLKTEVGQGLLPVMTSIAQTLTPIVEELGEPLGKIAEVVGGALSEAFDAIAPVIPIVAKAFADIAGVVAGALGTALSALIPVLTPVLETFASLVEKIGPLLQPLLDKIAGLLANVLSALVPLIDPLTEFVFTLLEALAPILDIVVDVLMILVDALKPILNAIIPILPALSSLIELLGKILTPILEALTPVIEVLANVLSDVLVRAVGLILTALGYLIIGFSKLAPFVLENVTKPIVSAFITMAENVVGAAASMLGWVPGLGDKLNEAKDAIGTFRTQAEDAISGAADTIGKEGAKIGQELVDQGVTSMTNPEAVKKTKNAGIKMGQNLAGGVMQGLQNTQLDVNSTSASMIQGAIDAANKTAGVKSPSTVFAEMGRMLTAGLVQGIREGGDDVRKVLQESFVSWFSETKNKLKTELDDAKGAFNDFASSVSGAITSAINFGAANEMTTVNAAGETVGMTFMEGLRAQASQAVEFAKKVEEVIALKLSPAALTQVLSTGAVAGVAIIDELIAGGVGAITETNDLVSSTQAAADKVGEMAATNFHGAGVKSAQETYNGFKDNFGKGGPARKAMENLMDNLAESLNRTSTITVTTVNKVLTQYGSTNSKGDLVFGAEGGIVNRPTMALIGEAGPEAVIPLDRTRGNSPLPMTGGGRANSASTTINLTVNAGMGTQGAEVGRQIVDALKAYERRNGSVYVSA
jgi:phage-related protein